MSVENMRDREYCHSILKEYTKSEALLKHAYAVEACVVAYAEKRYGFIVDSVNEGQAEIVIKSLGDYMPHIEGIAGGTIMGDGRVRLIVDIQEMISLAAETKGKKESVFV